MILQERVPSVSHATPCRMDTNVNRECTKNRLRKQKALFSVGTKRLNANTLRAPRPDRKKLNEST